MSRYFLILIFIVLGCNSSIAQLQAYNVFDRNGKVSNSEKMFSELEKADIILFGELHNDPIIHWMQYHFAKHMLEKYKQKIVLGAEMFEADNQARLNDYLANKITQKAMDTLVRLWPNYYTDYKPLVDLAKSYQAPFIASNIPRKYARQVNYHGLESLDTLSNEVKKFIAPLPIVFDPNLPGYRGMIQMMGDHASPNMIKAQAIKDATMAHFILSNWKEGQKFIHFNGTYHSNNFDGIFWYLKRLNPDVKIMTIAAVSQKKVKTLEPENRKLGDFTICVDESMTKTH
jgi:uncharacterized iron-regulated protein